jgi:erythromycin esterase-like protein
MVRAGLPGSYEALFHEVAHTGMERFQIDLRPVEARDVLEVPRLQRAIGVVYRPQTERLSHYFRCRLPQQFDWMIHIDTTRALTPLDSSEHWRHDEVPETWPTGL